MASEKYKIFISSRMEEFKEERKKIKEELGTFFNTFVYENDAGARAMTIRDTYTEELSLSDLYIGIFGKGYGKYTEDEFRSARERNIDCLIYEQKLSENEKRDGDLSRLITEISRVESKDGLTLCRFTGINDLILSIERDVGRWVKSRDSSIANTIEKPKLDIGRKYYCDREDQTIDFRIADKEDKFNFFIIDGAKKQSHRNLVKRFSLDKTASDNVKNSIAIDDKGSIARLKIFIQMQLFEKFGVKPIPSDMSLETLAQSILNDKYEKVFIIFRIEEDLLSNKNIKEAIHWFTKEYCEEKRLPAGSPDFYFFLVIRYNETGASKKKSIQKLLKNFKEYIKLEELDNVGLEHLRQWVEAHGLSGSETGQEIIVSRYFEKDTYPMEEAEIGITKLILDYNNENQELMDLMNKY